MTSLITPIAQFFENAVVFTWDALLELGNLVVPKIKEGHVVPEGRHGFQGKWPEYKRPEEGDSRCCCPALNALANHGILPRDGRNISFKELTDVVRTTYNFAPSFCYFVPKYAANMLHKDYNKDRFDLEEISMHNGIEHDASLTRLDHVFDKDQGKPHMPYVQGLLDSASGKDKAGNVLLTGTDIAGFCAKRRAESTVSNPSFSLALIHRMFSSSNNCTLLTVFGGRYDDIKVFLTEERLLDGWESRVRKVNGLTIAAFNTVVIPVEFRTASKTKALVEEYKANAEQNRA
ncbi:Chloroperoxidase [Amanita muscaria]